MKERRVLLALILLFLAALKWGFNPGIGRNSLDGDYYFQVARHVAEGDGLKTSVSLYHQALRPLPYPTNIYPLWPLVLGWSAKLLPLTVGATLLPELFYLVGLGLLYPLANRLYRRMTGGDPALLAPGGACAAGHLAVLLLGFNPVFFNFSSLPYTEALAFVFLFGALLAFDRAVERHGLGWSVAAGALATLSYLTRSQLLGLLPAVLLLLALSGSPPVRRARSSVVAAATALLLLAPWVAYLASFVRPFNPRVMLTVGDFRLASSVAPFQWNVSTESGWEYLADRMRSVAAALDPWSPYSYVESYGLAVWLVPIAAVAALGTLRKRPRLLLPPLAKDAALPLACLLTGFLLLLPLHLSHSRLLGEWRFGHRHGLPLLLLLLPAAFFLLRHPRRALRWLAWSLLAMSIVSGTFRSVHLLTVRFPSGLLGPEPELVEWLDGQQPRPSVVTTNPQTLAVYSRAGFHWMECREDGRKTRLLVEEVGADFVLLYAGEESCAFARGIEQDFELVREFSKGRASIAVYAPRRRTAPRPGHPTEGG